MEIAIREGIILGVHQKMVNYFPEFSWENLDPRKSQITIQQMLQMCSGYPWEEMDGYYDVLTPYSFNIYGQEILTYIHQLNYGYKWLSGTVGNHNLKFAWGHGGQLIVILYDLRMVIVTTADYLPGQYGQGAWNKEKSVLDLVGEFISFL